MYSINLDVPDTTLLLEVSGSSSEHLRILEKELGVAIGQRGSQLYVKGPRRAVELTKQVVSELLELVGSGSTLSEMEVLRIARALKKDPQASFSKAAQDVVLVAPRGLITPKSTAQQQYVRAIREKALVFGIGPAGTGKTYLAMAMAVHALLERRIKRIVLARPAVEAGEKLGYLPGDLADKVNPYLRPLYDALHDMMDVDKVQGLIQRGAIEVAPLAFMRGRTLNDSFVILDEAQNTTIDQMKMFLTRFGQNAKVVVTGDITQIDLPLGQPSGLIDAVKLLNSIDGIGICSFDAHDVVRHPLVQQIIREYDRRDSRSKP
mgnify:CR=1 FL=1